MKGWMDGLLCSPGQVRKEAASVDLNWVVQLFALLAAKLLKPTNGYLNRLHRFKK